jgi:hypothetical protein
MKTLKDTSDARTNIKVPYSKIQHVQIKAGRWNNQEPGPFSLKLGSAELRIYISQIHALLVKPLLQWQ